MNDVNSKKHKLSEENGIDTSGKHKLTLKLLFKILYMIT